MQIPWKFSAEYGIMFLLFFTLKLPRILLTLIMSCDFLSFSPLALLSVLSIPLFLLVPHGSMALSTVYMALSCKHHLQLWKMVMDREAWHAEGHGVTKSRTQLSNNASGHDSLVQFKYMLPPQYSGGNFHSLHPSSSTHTLTLFLKLFSTSIMISLFTHLLRSQTQGFTAFLPSHSGQMIMKWDTWNPRIKAVSTTMSKGWYGNRWEFEE